MNKRHFSVLVLYLILVFSGHAFAADYLNDAQKYLDKGEYKAAIIQLKKQLKKNPKDARVRYLLGSTYLKTGQNAAAEKELKIAYRLNSDNPDTVLAYAQLLVLQQEYEQLLKLLEQPLGNKDDELQRQIYLAYAYLGQGQLADAQNILAALVQENQNIKIYNGLALIALQEQEIEKASRWIDKALSLETDNKEALLLKAKVAIAEQHYVEALEIYDEVKKSNSNDLSLILARAAVLVAFKRFDEAEKEIGTVLEQIENQPHANYLLAQIKLQQGNFKAAKLAAQAVLNLAPKHTPSMLILGTAHLGQGNFNQAEKYIVQYLSANPDNLIAQNLLANVYLGKGKTAQAIIILEDIDEQERTSSPQILATLSNAYLMQYDIKPDNKVLLATVKIMLVQGKQDKAIKLLSDELQKNELNLTAQFAIATLYQQNKQIIEAAEHYQKILDIKEDHAPSLNNLAWISFLQNDQQAITLAKKAYEIDPDVAAITDTYGYILLKQGNTPEGIALLEKASQKSPDNSDIQYHLSEGYFLNNEKQKARTILEKILNQETSFSEKENAKTLLQKTNSL